MSEDGKESPFSASDPDSSLSRLIVETLREPMLVLDKHLRVILANPAFYRNFQVPRKETVDRFVYEVGNGQWNVPELRKLLEGVLPRRSEFNDFRVDHEFLKIGRRVMLLNARRFNKHKLILLAIEDITERAKIESRTRDRATELEESVAERSEELRFSIKELESFCRTVAHDLSTPLRTIVSFSQIIQKRWEDRLNPEARDYIARIAEAGKHIGWILDHLLNLSRVARKAMSRQAVDLTSLSRTLMAKLRAREPNREVDFRAKSGLRAHGDRELLRVALQNLLSNAWKFTRKTERARIEFGKTASNGKTAFFVRDNGIGFDMAYASRLFEAFQKLHNDREFGGAGIGLATAQRIIERHGGEIWAESSMNKGATFYFTLPEMRAPRSRKETP